jgi:hypothetical protein
MFQDAATGIHHQPPKIRLVSIFCYYKYVPMMYDIQVNTEKSTHKMFPGQTVNIRPLNILIFYGFMVPSIGPMPHIKSQLSRINIYSVSST